MNTDRQLVLSRALVLGGVAASVDTLLSLTTGALPPEAIAFNTVVLVGTFEIAVALWIFGSQSPLLRISGEAFLILVSIAVFSLRGCFYDCGAAGIWRVVVPLGLAASALGVFGALRRVRPARARSCFIFIAVAAMALAALDLVRRESLALGSKSLMVVVLAAGVLPAAGSFVVRRGWMASLAWAVLLGVASATWARYRGAPLWIEPASQRTTALGSAAGVHPPNVILIVLDAVRADHLSLYGYPRKTTPNLDALAAESLVFEHAVASGNYSLSSHASLFTGLLPTEHGAHPRPADNSLSSAFGRIDSSLGTGVETLASRLGKQGFTTGGVSANFAYLARWTGLQQGFDAFDDRPRTLTTHHPFSFPLLRHLARPALPLVEVEGWDAETVTAAGSHFATNAREPFLLFLNYLDAHEPYSPRPRRMPLEDRKGGNAPPVAAYDSEIASADAAVGTLVGELRDRSLLDRTIVVVTADHGEYLGEHGFRKHGVGANEEVLHVPLLVRYPKALRPGRVDRAFGLHEVRRLVLDLVGAHPTEWVFQGGAQPRVLAQIWGRVTSDDTIARARAMDPDANVVYAGSFKFVDRRLGPDALYDLAVDPKEQNNLLAQPSPQITDLRNRMQASAEKLTPSRRGQEQGGSDGVEALRALGYISPRKPGSK